MDERPSSFGKDAQAGRFARQLVEGIDVAVFDLLVGNDADGLRDFALGGGDFCANGGGKGAVFFVGLGGIRAVAALGFDEDGVERFRRLLSAAKAGRVRAAVMAQAKRLRGCMGTPVS